MKMKSRRIKILIVALTLNMLFVGCVMGDLTFNKATNVVEKFTGTMAPLTYNYVIGNVYAVYSSGENVFYINQFNEVVEGAVFNSNRLHSEKSILSTLQAGQKAKDFAEKNYPNFTSHNMSLVSEKFIDHGAAGSEYQYIWKEYVSDIETPNSLIISINPNSGEVMDYIGIERPITIPLTNEVISKEAVIKIATDEFQGIKIKNVTAFKSIDVDNNNHQHLVWHVEIEGYPIDEIMQGGKVIIDALNGAILVKDPYS